MVKSVGNLRKKKVIKRVVPLPYKNYNKKKRPMLCGGHSEERKPGSGEIKFLTSAPIRKLIEDEMKKASAELLTVLEPTSITTQVVAGTNYKVKYHIGNDKYIHAKIFEPLPCNEDEVPQILNFEINKSETDRL